MNTKKIFPYAATVAIFALISLACFRLISTSADTSSRVILSDWMQVSKEETRRRVALRARGIAVLFGGEDYGGIESIGSAIYALQRIESRSAASRLAVMDRNGNLYDSRGNRFERSVDLEGMTFQSGFEVAFLHERSDDRESILLILPVPGNETYYLVSMESKEVFAGVLLEGLSISGEGVAIFDERGNFLRASARSKAQEQEVTNLVSSGIAAFRSDGGVGSVLPLGRGSYYRAYVALQMPPSWFLAGLFSVTQLQPLSKAIYGVMLLLFLAFLSVTLLIAFRETEHRAMMRSLCGRINSSDPLTGLANGTVMRPMIEGFLKANPGVDYSLICIDVKAFHRFNTIFGYEAGDRLLRAIAGVLNEKYECGVRLNSDVFITLSLTTQNMIDDLRTALTEAASRQMGSTHLRAVSFRFGVCRITEGPGSFRDVFDGALLAMKDAKKLVAPNDVVYGKELQSRTEMQKKVEMNMLHAMSKGEFRVYIQPKWSIASGHCCGGEALVRWESAELGFLRPDQFIPIFERNGFIVEVDFYMLECVLRMIRSELDRGLEPYPISVNVSKTTLLFPNYLERLTDVLERCCVPSRYIELEITESAMESADYSHIRSLLCQVKGMGFSLAMDDFGAGYSSLNTLRELPVDVLKIDRDFLAESVTSERSKKIIRRIVEMSRDINVKVVCEGVENDGHLSFLKSVRCDYGQGYLFSRPMPDREFEETFVMNGRNRV